MVSNRLKSLAKYFDKDDKVIDIGCDHALLDIYLVEEGILKSMIVSDIHEKALQQGIDNIKLHKLDKKIETRLGNGLEVLNSNDDINTVLISGMGTSTIINIIENSYFKNINKLVIQSNNDHEILRNEMVSKGFKIITEDILEDSNKTYINIVFGKGIGKYSKNEIKYGPFLIKNKMYLDYRIDYLNKILNKIPNNKLLIRHSLKKEIRFLNKLKKNI